MMKFVLFSTFLASTAASSGIVQQIQTLQNQRRAQSINPCETTGGEPLAVQSFYNKSLGTCTCTYSNDLGAELEGFDQDALGDPSTNENFLTDIVTLINDLLRSLSYEYSNSCNQVDCETCFGPICGKITASEKILVEGKSDANLTFADLFTLPGLQEALTNGEAVTEEEVVDANAADNATALAALFGPNLFTQNIIKYCMEFTTELSGEACLDIDNKLDGEILTTFTTEPQDCSLGYNGEMCTGCQFTVSDEASCVTADCTGVTGVNSMVDTCAGTGLVGPFQFLDGFADSSSTCGETEITTVCVGDSCGETEVITACEGTGCEAIGSGAYSVVSLMAVGVAAVGALMM